MNPHFNPFLISGYKDESTFCDRKIETLILSKNIKNGINTTIFAMRRIGKTGLIHHLFHKLQRNSKLASVYVDIYATGNLSDFTNALATAIYRRFPENRGPGKLIIEYIKKLRPIISFDALSGSPEITIEAGEPKQHEKTIIQLFEFMDSRNIHVVFAIDEFQQITTYPEKNVEALLRSTIQTLKNVSFIFCGSNQKIMHEMFNSAKRPFYSSCTNLNLTFISREEYANFIESIFKSHRRSITEDAVEYILQWTFGHTFYTQYVCNRLFATNIKKVQLENVIDICRDVLAVQESTFYQYRSLLTKAQWELLRAIAHEEKIAKLHSKDFLKKYQLGTTSTISRSLESLLEKELLYRETNKEGTFYSVNDKFLLRWLQGL